MTTCFWIAIKNFFDKIFEIKLKESRLFEVRKFVEILNDYNKKRKLFQLFCQPSFLKLKELLREWIKKYIQ